MSVATAVRVGNHVGAGLSRNAENAAKMALLTAGMWMKFIAFDWLVGNVVLLLIG